MGTPPPSPLADTYTIAALQTAAHDSLKLYQPSCSAAKHQTINQFELESKQQSHLLRKTLDNLLFDYKALPQYPNLHGKYTGCQLINGMLAPHNYKDAVFVDKELDIVNGSGSNLVNRYRLHDYDYDEVKGLVAGFNNAFVLQ
jgi:hypothetical protein